MRPKVYPVLLTTLCLGLSACITSNKPSGSSDASTADQGYTFPTLKVGEKWNLKVTDQTLGEATLNAEILSSQVQFNGVNCYHAKMSANIPKIEDEDGFVMSNVEIESKIYMRESDHEILSNELILTGTVTDSINGSSIVKVVTSEEHSIEGSYPANIKPGKIWSIKTTIIENNKVYVNDNLITQDDTTYTETKNYETTTWKDVIVPSGEFNAIELKWENVEDGTYGFEYYSIKAKVTVKSTEYKNGSLIASSELVSYVQVN